MFLRRASILAALALVACAGRDADSSNATHDEIESSNADEVTVDVGNDSAFLAKARRVEAIPDDGKAHTIDMAYYIYGDDWSSSYLTKRVLEKARRGAKVRILLDASQTSPDERKFFRMLMAQGGQSDGAPNLRVAYFRPTPPEVFEDVRSWGFSDPQAFVGAVFSFDMERVKAQLAANTLLSSSDGKKKAVATVLGLFGIGQADPGGLRGTIATLSSMPEPSLDTALDAAGKKLSAADARFTFRFGKWIEMSKFLHFKLLVVDGSYVEGGGRNIEDPYHWELDNPLRTEGRDHYVFMDADFHVEDKHVGARATSTLDRFWECADRGPSACSAGINVQAESAEDSPELLAQLETRAATFAEKLGYTRQRQPIHDHRFVAANVPVTYIENRMFRDPAARSELLPEEKSQFHETWVRLIDEVPPDKSITIQNAYLLFPEGVQSALARAAKRGVRLTIVSNSAMSSDLGFIARLARLQYAPFLRLGENVHIYEYQTQESLHAKVSVLGENLIVGSTNADPRCELLDAQNGLVIGKAALRDDGKSYGSMAEAYGAWFDGLLGRLLVTPRPDKPELMLAREVTLASIEAERKALLDSFAGDPSRAQAAEATLAALSTLFVTSFELGPDGKQTARAKKASAVLKVLTLQI